MISFFFGTWNIIFFFRKSYAREYFWPYLNRFLYSFSSNDFCRVSVINALTLSFFLSVNIKAYVVPIMRTRQTRAYIYIRAYIHMHVDNVARFNFLLKRQLQCLVWNSHVLLNVFHTITLPSSFYCNLSILFVNISCNRT